MRITIVTRYVGLSLLLVASMMLVSAGVAFLSQKDDSMLPLLFSAILTGTCGSFPLIFVRPGKKISDTESYFVVVFSWLFCCLFGMIPYVLFSNEYSMVDALFESVSGFTTTGASIFNDIESIPKGLQFWRMSSCWIGGIGIVSLFSLLIPKNRDIKSKLSGAELSDIVLSGNRTQNKNIVRTILYVYLFLTLSCMFSLRLTGLDWFNSAVTAMSTCSTCGFGVLNDSIAGYHNIAAETVIIFFMTMSGINFISIFGLFKRNGRALEKYETILVYVSLILIGSVLVFTDLKINDPESHCMEILLDAAFQVTSIITTTGFATADTSLWPDASRLFLIIASFVCGCSGSTSGGIKIDRVVIMAKACHNRLVNIRNPHRFLRLTVNGKTVSSSIIGQTFLFLVFYLCLVMLGSIINIICGLDIESGFSAAMACMGNVGPGFGEVGSFGNYADIPTVAKLSNMLLMLLGRLEILPVIIVINQIRHK